MSEKLFIYIFLLFSMPVMAQSKNEIAVQGGTGFDKGKTFVLDYNRSIGKYYRHQIGGRMDYLAEKTTSFWGVRYQPMALLFCPYYEYRIIDCT